MLTDDPTLSLNKAVLRRFYEEIWNQKDYAALDEIIAPDFVWQEPMSASELTGVARAREFLHHFFESFPDYVVTVEDMVAEGDRVVIRWISEATHAGNLRGIPATGRRFKLPGISIAQVRQGKLTQYRTMMDNFLLLTSLGVL